MEQRQSAQPAGVGAGTFLLEENAAEWSFGAVLEQHVAFVLAEIGREAAALVFAWWGQVELDRCGVGHGRSFRRWTLVTQSQLMRDSNSALSLAYASATSSAAKPSIARSPLKRGCP